MAGQYEYMPLAEHQIRLLTLFPGSFDDDIRLNLVPVRLPEDKPPGVFCIVLRLGQYRTMRDGVRLK